MRRSRWLTVSCAGPIADSPCLGQFFLKVRRRQVAHVVMEPVGYLVKVLAVAGLWITEDADAVPL